MLKWETLENIIAKDHTMLHVVTVRDLAEAVMEDFQADLEDKDLLEDVRVDLEDVEEASAVGEEVLEILDLKKCLMLLVVNVAKHAVFLSDLTEANQFYAVIVLGKAGKMKVQIVTSAQEIQNNLEFHKNNSSNLMQSWIKYWKR